jgi:hypothetical protein
VLDAFSDSLYRQFVNRGWDSYCWEVDALRPKTPYTRAMLLQRDLIRRLFLLFLILIVLVGLVSLLLDIFAGTEILLTLLNTLHPPT